MPSHKCGIKLVVTMVGTHKYIIGCDTASGESNYAIHKLNTNRMQEFKFNQSMYNKQGRYISLMNCNRITGGKFPPSDTANILPLIRLVSEHTANWKHFEYISTRHKKRTPGGILPIEYYAYYNADMNVTARCYP